MSQVTGSRQAACCFNLSVVIVCNRRDLQPHSFQLFFFIRVLHREILSEITCLVVVNATEGLGTSASLYLIPEFLTSERTSYTKNMKVTVLYMKKYESNCFR